MRQNKPSIRVGLQVKAVMILAFLVLGTTWAGGWVYYSYVCKWLKQSEFTQAERLADALSLSSATPLADSNRSALQRLARDFLNNENVLYVAFIDANGQDVLAASRGARGQGAQPLVPEPPTLSYTRPATDNCLVIARPVLSSSQQGKTFVGAVRLTFDTSVMDRQLRMAHRTMLLLACCIMVATIPIGYLLVWRVLVLPVRRLMTVTHRLAEGDFTARAQATHNDEIGHLAESFNAMSQQLDVQRQQLLAANEQLETKVRQRTAQLNSANERLRGEMAEKEDFLRAVSHDLNAPLRNIAGMATMVMMKWRDELPEEVIARLQRIQANVDAETELITELLELSRIKTQPQSRERTAMGDVMEHIRSSLEYDLRQKNIDLVIQPGMPTLYVERNRMRQIFQNLADNAIKYMGDRKDARIEIGYECREGEHIFHVADNGPGIAPEDQQKIFYVFRRATSAAASKIPGKGVGLATVKSIVSNYEGRVWVQSELGVGSTFHVSLACRCTEVPAEDLEYANTHAAT